MTKKSKTEAPKPPKDDVDAFRQAALDYHQYPNPGKVAIRPTKPMATQTDLALAYSPGVAAPCEEIEKDPSKAYDYTSKGNLVAVISDGTAVLGLGNLGALASKPVMEGKSILFKKFANVDSVDVEIDLKMPADGDRSAYIDKFVEVVAALEPTYGGINLEDIKAPECFEIERRLKERMNIPVFHDDQHGTAIIVGAAFKNWIKWSGRDINKIRLVCSGAGASAIACLTLLVNAGLKRENIIVCDRNGVIYEGRNKGMDPAKQKFASKTKHRELKEAIAGADIFLGLSGPGAVDKAMIASMADAPLVLALANPTPEIMPADAKAAKPNCIVCTGRSDFPNQVNNVLGFPYIFRGALDVGATTINEEMKLACVEAIAQLARKEVSAEVTAVYNNEDLSFGPEYLIPKPFDPRLIIDLPMAVAKAAMDSGVATRPIKDFEAYKHKLSQFFVRSQLIMRPIYTRAAESPKRVVYCEGEEERVLQAVQTVLDEKIAKPIIIGREKVVATRIKRLGLRMTAGDYELVDPEDDARFRDYSDTYHDIMERRGVTPADARTKVRTSNTVIGSLMVNKNDADAILCGTLGQYERHLKNVIDILGLKPGVETPAAMNALLLTGGGTYFFCDTQINPDPSIAQISEMTLLAAEEVRRFGVIPKVALLSHSNFGTSEYDSPKKMRAAYLDLRRRDPNLQIDGEMQADAALSEELRKRVMPNSNLTGTANLFIMPNVDAAHIAFNMLKLLADGISIGPLLLGAARPAHILTPTISPRGIVNVSALAVVAAQIHEEESRPVKASSGRAAKRS